VHDASQRGAPITWQGNRDPRITRMGRILRKTKIDELPQLVNVLRGDMSLVGPRPEISEYVNRFRADYEQILQVRPGITDLASLEYRDEAGLLERAAHPEDEYVRRILPHKIELSKQYLRTSTPSLDVAIICRTLLRILRPMPPASSPLGGGSDRR
jgi:lipopolysaccharide/colanic/teichoic acid biosynthesis glycosyltransferase